MATIRLIAARKFSYTTALVRQTRSFTAGEAFEAEPIDAAVLVYQQQATFAPPSTAQHMASPDGPPQRRRYRRRDMQAETAPPTG